jgi:RAB protein geranylgeranyltransferase component A
MQDRQIDRFLRFRNIQVYGDSPYLYSVLYAN